MTGNKTKTTKTNKRNQKNKKLRNNNIIYIIETFVLTAIAVFTSVLSGMFYNNLTGLFCVIIASALFACDIFLISPGMILISGIASFAITYSANGNVLSALASLIYVFIGTFIYFGVRTKKNRTQITLGIAVLLVIFYLGMLFTSFMLETGSFSIGMVSSMIDGKLTDGAEQIIRQYNQMLGQYPAAGTEEAAQAAYFVETYAQELAINFKAIIPAVFVVYTSVIAYLSTSLFKWAYNIFIPMANPGRKRIKNKYWRINISYVSAIVMSCALFFGIILSKNENVLPSIVLMNLIYILAPGFCIMGIYFVYDKLLQSMSGIIPVIFIIGLIMLAFISPVAVIFILYAMLAVLMAAGIYAALADEVRKFLDKAKKAFLGNKYDDDDDDDDDDGYDI